MNSATVVFMNPWDFGTRVVAAGAAGYPPSRSRRLVFQRLEPPHAAGGGTDQHDRRGKPAAAPKGNAESYELILRANHFTRQNTGSSLAKAVSLDHGAIDKRRVAEIQKEQSAGYRDHALAIAFHAIGEREQSDAALKRLLGQDEQWAFQFASAHACRGEADEAFRWLDRAFELNDAGVVLSRVISSLASLHADPRWPRYLQTLGLPE